MHYGIYVSTMGAYGDPALLRDLAVEAEAAGWEGFFVWDVLNGVELGSPVADPWVVLAAIAQATSAITVGPLVVPVPRRHPAKLALEARTLQVLSGDRLVLGVGTGVDEDHTRFGDAADRRLLGERLDDGMALVHALLSGEPVDHDGPHHQAHGVRFAAAEVPVWTSGFWPRAAPVRGARGASGVFPLSPGPAGDYPLPSPEEVRARRSDFVAAGGRPDGDLVLWSPRPDGAPDAARTAAYEEAGATWWLQDGSALAPDGLRRRIAAGPPRS